MLSIYDISLNGDLDAKYFPNNDIRIGWKIKSNNEKVFQTKYRITIQKNDDCVYDTGIVNSDNSNQIKIEKILDTKSDYCVKIEITDNYGEKAVKEKSFSTAMNNDEWEAKWIKPRKHIEGWAPYIRTKFVCFEKEIKAAKLYICTLGCGEIYLNSKKITEDMIDPPFTNYEKEILYRIYDVKEFLQGKNALTVLLGDGWYSQNRVWAINGYKYADVCLIAQLEIEYSDGTVQKVLSDENDNWKCKNSPLVLNNIYGGETYDARLETDDFAEYYGDEDEWGQVIEDDIPKSELKICVMPAVRVVKEILPISVKEVSGSSDGSFVFDMGENFAGIIEINLPKSPKGQQLVFRFAETVNPDGSLDFRSSGSFATKIIQQNIYICKGLQEEKHRFNFCYHSFRYVEITGYYCSYSLGFGVIPPLETIKGYQISTNLRKNGEFECSNDDINKLQKIMERTFVSNYHGFPEDCPAREKCGWLGDAQIVCNYAIMGYDMRSSYEKYLNDFRTMVETYGRWNMIAPGKRDCGEASPLWGCAQVLMPYWMYIYYADEFAVKSNWDLMQKWVEHEENRAEDYIITQGLGDWCVPLGDKSDNRIPVEESSTLMFFEICKRMSELCEKLNLQGREKYDNLMLKIKESFIRHYWDEKNRSYRYVGTNAVALSFGIYPENERENVLNALVSKIHKLDYAMVTGIYGNKYLVNTLFENGYGDLALKILFNRDYFSFATMMDQGATSLFEVLENRLIGQPKNLSTSSLNHPMHSGFAYTFYSCIGGIKPIKAGFKEFSLEPCMINLIPQAKVKYESVYGEIFVSYKKTDEKTEFEIVVPENTKCIFKNKGCEKTLLSGRHKFEC